MYKQKSEEVLRTFAFQSNVSKGDQPFCDQPISFSFNPAVELSCIQTLPFVRIFFKQAQAQFVSCYAHW